ncbi:unnamed protein product [Mytilus coruscus]|uniref:Integrase zinc-binding domain-containing protein n=1 Tax=Mytilus coruscus TaxID=42192 RepID=A0A6J8BUV1_MYTCO|nr:unnamed protein product [Mytilus coruscus]
MPSSYSHDDLRQLQNHDKHLSTIIAWLTLNHNPSKQELQMQSPGVRHLWQCKSQLRYQDSILSYVWEDPVASRILFVTPDSLKDELLRCCHDLRSSGHLGQDKTLSKLRKTAYWTRRQKELTKYIKALREALTEVHVLARENIKMAQWRQKRDYDLNSNCKVYEVGDIVFKIDSARKIGVCPKLKAPWKGPFVVAEVKSPVLYKIRNKKTSEVIRHDRLKLSQIRDLPVWTQRLKKRILENLEMKMLEDLIDKEEHQDLGLDWLFSNHEQTSGNMIVSSLAQSDSLTVDSNTGRGQSDFLANRESSQKAEQFTLQDWETLMSLDDNFGDQTIIYNVTNNVDAQVKLPDRNRGRDRKTPAHFKDFIMN